MGEFGAKLDYTNTQIHPAVYKMFSLLLDPFLYIFNLDVVRYLIHKDYVLFK
jgi:hypothetical protein